MKASERRFAPSAAARDDLVGVAASALEPAHVWVWTRTPPGTR